MQRPFNTGANTDITFLVKSGLPAENNLLYLVFKERKTVARIYASNDGEGQYTISNVPSGLDVTLIAFSFNNNKAYFFREEFVVSEEMELEVEFTQISEDQLVDEIRKID